MDKAYYLKYYEFEQTHWWFRARAEILKDYITKNCGLKKGGTILNVGAATGGSIAWLSELGEVTSLEYDRDSALFIRDHLRREVVEGSVLSLPFPDSSFDFVCAFDVIEHVGDDQLAVRELSRVAKKGCSVLVTVPAFMHLWSPHDEINHHHRRYTVTSLTNILTQLSGGAIEFITYFNSRLYLPIALVRKVGNIFARLSPKKELQSDFEKFKPGRLNDLLFSIMIGEKRRISAKKMHPVGVSILAHWKKNNT